MMRQTKEIYEFGPFRLDQQERLLQRDGATVPLTPKAFDLLLALVEQHGHLLEKDELLRQVWPDSFVEEANLASNISQLRKALGEGENGQRYIETVPKRGYRFVAEVAEVGEQMSVVASVEPRESQAVEVAAAADSALLPTTHRSAAIARRFTWFRQNKRAAVLLFSPIVLLVAGMAVAWRPG